MLSKSTIPRPNAVGETYKNNNTKAGIYIK